MKTVTPIALKTTGVLLMMGACAFTPLVSRADPAWWTDVNTSSWYPFNATNSAEPGEIGMASWQGPIGQYGRPMRDGDRFVCNNQPIKFWGFNICSSVNLSPAEYDVMAPFYAKYGVNLIRFHKVLEGALNDRSNWYKLNESAGGPMEKFDYFMWKLKQAGIYVNFSPSWHIHLYRDNLAEIPYWKEFYGSYTRGAPAMAQIIRTPATGIKTLSFDAINNGTDISLGVRVYGVNGNFELDLTKTNGIGTLLGQITVTASSTNWVTYQNTNINLGSGYDHIIVFVWSDGILNQAWQYIDNVFLGTGTANLITDGTFSNLNAAPLIAGARLRTQADAGERWHCFSPSFWVRNASDSHVGCSRNGGLNHPRPGISTESGFGSIPTFIYFLPEFQEMKIKQIENLLNHTNKSTNVKYANEPQVVMVEMHNETSIYGISDYLRNGWMTTLRQRACQMFCDFLRQKYGTHETLAAAWNPGKGNNGLDHWATLKDEPSTVYPEQGFPNQRLDLNNIPPLMLPNGRGDAHPGCWARARDTAEFYYLTQRDYYHRFRDRIRATGYTGEIIASNWTVEGYYHNHYLNLNADADVGMIDRHGAYEAYSNKSLLSVPGGQFLGWVQDADRPFMISEWCQSFANPFTIESRVIMAAYGLGLQGWDAAAQFPGPEKAGITRALEFGNQYFNPQVAALYPFLVRMIHRGDVAEGQAVVKRPAHLPSVQTDALLSFVDFRERQYGLVAHGGALDRSNLTSTNIHPRTPAVAKCQVKWTDSYQSTPRFPIEEYRKTIGEDTYYHASNHQLTWREGLSETDGAVTINTPGTQGVVGFFKQDQIVDLDHVKIQFLNPGVQFASVLVTAKAREKTLANAEEILVLAVARARNTGMVYDASGKVITMGTSPVLMEPVKARVWIKCTGTMNVKKLDHDGFLGGAVAVNASDNSFTINGVNDKTPYYKATRGLP